MTGFGVRSLLKEIKYLFKFIFSFLRFGVMAKCGVEFRHSYAMLPEFGGKWGADCHNTRFLLPKLLFAEYSLKLNKKSYMPAIILKQNLI